MVIDIMETIKDVTNVQRAVKIVLKAHVRNATMVIFWLIIYAWNAWQTVKKCKGKTVDDCNEWYFGETADSESFIDNEINENCYCNPNPNPKPNCSKYLIEQISFIILLLLILLF